MTRSILMGCIFLALCGCRRDYEDEPWHEPDWRDAPPERPDPRPRTAEDFVERAREEIKEGRHDDARVTLYQAFRRDRFNPAANTVYQNLMLELGRFDIIWREYTDLYQHNRERGDAFWFHIRPLLRRGEQPVAPERGGDVAAQRKKQDEWAPEDIAAMIKHYAALADDDPSSGNLLYLSARARGKLDKDAAFEMLREGLILELPGVWLRVGLAELCFERAEAVSGDDRDSLRSREGWDLAAATLLLRAKDADPNHPGVLELEVSKPR